MQRLTSSKKTLPLLAVLVAFSIRVAVSVAMGEANFWSGYIYYYEMAQDIVAGKGFGIASDVWSPVYPLFLALTMYAGNSYLIISLLQAAVGAGTVYCAFLIGRELFDQPTGIIASFLTALYPYYAKHDTALQETGLFTFLTALSLFFLLKTLSTSSKLYWMLAGLFLGLATLTRVTLEPFILLVLPWILCFGGPSGRQRVEKVAIVFLSCSLIVSPWLVRNHFVLKGPTLWGTGFCFWIANNPNTFSYYPRASMDLSAQQSLAALKPEESKEFLAIPDSADRDAWFARKGFEFIRSQPLQALRGALLKVITGFSWTFSPARQPVIQAVYFLSYLPILILGTIGMLLNRRQWRRDGPIYLLFLTFIAVSAVFWAHTSHRTHLDLYLIIFSTYTVRRYFSHRESLSALW